MANPTRAKLIFKVIAAVTARTAALGTLLFFSAGTLAWWRGWVFLAVMVAATATMMLGVNQDLVAECLKGPFQKRVAGRQDPGRRVDPRDCRAVRLHRVGCVPATLAGEAERGSFVVGPRALHRGVLDHPRRHARERLR